MQSGKTTNRKSTIVINKKNKKKYKDNIFKSAIHSPLTQKIETY